jgi:Flp pilus assembly protein TadD
MAGRGDRGEAVAHFKQALDLRPDWASPMTGLTWLWATAANATEDDIAHAVQFGERAAVLTGRSDPSVLDALAAAYAAAGQYDRAVTTAELAMQTATTARIPALAAEIKQRLVLYQSRKPFRVGPR